MNDNEVNDQAQDLGFWKQHRFLILIGASIAVSLILVSISMTIYATSGASQLDLSRPGYQGVTSQADDASSDSISYPSSGNLDAKAINSFRTIFDTQASSAKTVEAFSGDPLNPDTLGISAPQPTN